ncbi:hypothetical protein Trydic_g17286 [Trypoxylus dichotomus]
MALVTFSKCTQFSVKCRPLFLPIIRNHWYKDYKPLPFPKTQEEREAAAAKYELTVADYKVYKDDGMGLGDYPKLPDLSDDEKDPFYPWDNPELKRNFGEPIHMDFDLINEVRYNISAKHRFPGWVMWLQFLMVTGGALFIQFYLERCKMFFGLLPKQYPLQGKTHYTFQSNETE